VVLGTYRPIRIWFYIQQKLFAAEENSYRKSAMGKNFIFFKVLFHQEQMFFLNISFLFLMQNYGKCMIKKVKKIFSHGKKDGEMLIGYTFRVGYTVGAG
jgi:hypothetical protein